MAEKKEDVMGCSSCSSTDCPGGICKIPQGTYTAGITGNRSGFGSESPAFTGPGRGAINGVRRGPLSLPAGPVARAAAAAQRYAPPANTSECDDGSCSIHHGGKVDGSPAGDVAPAGLSVNIAPPMAHGQLAVATPAEGGLGISGLWPQQDVDAGYAYALRELRADCVIWQRMSQVDRLNLVTGWIGRRGQSAASNAAYVAAINDYCARNAAPVVVVGPNGNGGAQPAPETRVYRGPYDGDATPSGVDPRSIPGSDASGQYINPAFWMDRTGLTCAQWRALTPTEKRPVAMRAAGASLGTLATRESRINSMIALLDAYCQSIASRVAGVHRAGEVSAPAAAPAGVAPSYTVMNLDPLVWLANTPAQRVEYFLKLNPNYVGSPWLASRIDEITAWAMRNKPNVRPAAQILPKGYMRQPMPPQRSIAKILDDALKAGGEVAPAGLTTMNFTEAEANAADNTQGGVSGTGGGANNTGHTPSDTSVPGDESDPVRLQRLRNEAAEATAAINALVSITNNTVNTVNATDQARIAADARVAITNLTHNLEQEGGAISTADRQSLMDQIAALQRRQDELPIPTPAPTPAPGMSTGTKIGLVALGLAVLGGGAALAANSKKKGK